MDKNSSTSKIRRIVIKVRHQWNCSFLPKHRKTPRVETWYTRRIYFVIDAHGSMVKKYDGKTTRYYNEECASRSVAYIFIGIDSGPYTFYSLHINYIVKDSTVQRDAR